MMRNGKPPWHRRHRETRLERLLVPVALGLAELFIAQAAAAPSAVKSHADSSGKEVPAETRWQDLIPPGWDGMKAFGPKMLGSVNDGSPRAAEVMEQMRAVMDNAPTNPRIEGHAVRLVGYVVPLEALNDQTTEFLLVPYFGACIHVPPPPANQIVHVIVDKPLVNYRSMDAVRVSGVLNSARFDSGLGEAGYQLHATSVDPFVPH